MELSSVGTSAVLAPEGTLTPLRDSAQTGLVSVWSALDDAFGGTDQTFTRQEVRRLTAYPPGTPEPGKVSQSTAYRHLRTLVDMGVVVLLSTAPSASDRYRLDSAAALEHRLPLYRTHVRLSGLPTGDSPEWLPF